jgi:SPP1 family predicted phage head-tail adaptor
MPNASNFRDYVELQTRSTTSDGMGGSVDEWSSAGNFWCKVTPLSANQRLYAKRLEENITHKIVTRYRSDLTVGIEQRILWRGRLFQIQSVIDIEERRQFLEIMAVEGSAT